MPNVSNVGTVPAMDLPASGVPAIVQKVVKRWKIMRNTRKTVVALTSLSDHELKDIGISRGDIRHVATHASQMTAY